MNLPRWLADARALASPHLVTVLVGNKSDREEEREVEWTEASRWAAENGSFAILSFACHSHIHHRLAFPRSIVTIRR